MYLGRRVEAGRDDPVVRAGATAVQLAPPFVVDADHALRGIIGREQVGLGLEVRLERVMVVQVVLREVRERRDGEVRVPGPQQVQRVRRDLHGHDVAAGIAHAGERFLQIRRLGRRVLGFLVLIANLDAHRAHDAGPLAGGPRDLIDQVGRGRLSVRACHAHEREALRWRPVKTVGHVSHSLAGILDDDLGHVGGVRQVDLALHDDELGAAVDGILGKGVAVDLQADYAEEHIARHDGVAAVRKTAHLIRAIADDRALKPFEQFRTDCHKP